MNPIHIYSEITPLKEVVLHRPGRELNNLTPDYMDNLLFDEIPYLDRAQQEHDYFADTLRKIGATVYYLEDLASEVITDPKVKKEFLDIYIQECRIPIEEEKTKLRQFLESYTDEKELILKTMEGTRRSELNTISDRTLTAMVTRDRRPFIAEPMPNLYFTRDPFSFVGKGVLVNHMWSLTRNRETLYGQMIMQYHDKFRGQVPMYYQRHEKDSIEGGDVLVLGPKTVAIGISQRTSPQAIENFSTRLFAEEDFREVLCFQIPEKREFMHLDTVFTMIDKDMFTIHPLIEDPLVVYKITRGQPLSIKRETKKIKDILEECLDTNITLIPCGGGDKLDASREQWNDGSNTLAVAPREVIVYDRNIVTNQLLEKNGVKLHIIPSGELSRGRGGPRCMSMPIRRD